MLSEDLIKGAREASKYLGISERSVYHMNAIAREQRRQSGWVYHTYKAKFGVGPAGITLHTTAEPTKEVRDYVKYRMIAYARSRAA